MLCKHLDPALQPCHYVRQAPAGAHQDTPVLASATITPSAASMAQRPWISSFSLKRSSEKTSLYGCSAVSLLTCAPPRTRRFAPGCAIQLPLLGARLLARAPMRCRRPLSLLKVDPQCLLPCTLEQAAWLRRVSRRHTMNTLHTPRIGLHITGRYPRLPGDLMCAPASCRA